ncbi:hypothetical protein E2C01_006266 [Portunus trituberculatus]|uniref:Uncharacterized protein n=1 Tax=Portunus trituberculatus TaxID=210409 RepID=A0A5B7CWF3_PORTR|nr:hypothetical protein [Portunus trituberculatus]
MDKHVLVLVLSYATVALAFIHAPRGSPSGKTSGGRWGGIGGVACRVGGRGEEERSPNRHSVSQSLGRRVVE